MTESKSEAVNVLQLNSSLVRTNMSYQTNGLVRWFVSRRYKRLTQKRLLCFQHQYHPTRHKEYTTVSGPHIERSHLTFKPARRWSYEIETPSTFRQEKCKRWRPRNRVDPATMSVVRGHPTLKPHALPGNIHPRSKCPRTSKTLTIIE